MTEQAASRDDDQSIVKEMSRLLLKKYTMLSDACPVCNTPIFRSPEGRVFCAKCKRDVLIVGSESDIPPELRTDEPGRSLSAATTDGPQQSVPAPSIPSIVASSSA